MKYQYKSKLIEHTGWPTKRFANTWKHLYKPVGSFGQMPISGNMVLAPNIYVADWNKYGLPVDNEMFLAFAPKQEGVKVH